MLSYVMNRASMAVELYCLATDSLSSKLKQGVCLQWMLISIPKRIEYE
jgi:hypothetical protein